MQSINDVTKAFNKSLINLYPLTEINSIKNLVLAEFTGFNNAYIKAFPEQPLSTEQITHIQRVLNKLQTGQPVQYILGTTNFYGLTFKVSPAVLIPRPETEELVEWIITSATERNIDEQILDIGTGSGCIPIALKKHLSRANVTAIDISSDALTIAKQNADYNAVDIKFYEDDILNTLQQYPTDYTLMVSNPPYVTLAEKAAMHTNVLAHEPHTALFVPDENPLIFYNAIANFAKTHLVAEGLLFFEINENLGIDTVDLLSQKGFKDIELKKDMSGKDRMIKAVN